MDKDTNGWVKLYTEHGALVTLAIPLDGSVTTIETAAAARLSVENFLAAGWLVEAPGLEEGEQKQEVVSVSRRKAKDCFGIVAFYLAHPKTVKKFMHVYLNTQEDVHAFESATGLRLDALPIWPAKSDIQKDDDEAAKYIIPLPRPIDLIWELNPKWHQWNTEGGKEADAQEPRKRLLVRYGVPAPVNAPTYAEPTYASPASAAPATGALKAVPAVTGAEAAPAAPAPRRYGDGVLVTTDPKVFAIFDAFVTHRGQAPMSAEGLKGWYAANKALVSLPTS